MYENPNAWPTGPRRGYRQFYDLEKSSRTPFRRERLPDQGEESFAVGQKVADSGQGGCGTDLQNSGEKFIRISGVTEPYYGGKEEEVRDLPSDPPSS